MVDTVISVRMSMAEARVLKESARSLGLSLSDYIRSIARRNDVLADLKREMEAHQRATLAAVESLADQLARSVRQAMNGEGR